MGKKHFTEEQIACALRQAESGTSVADLSLDDSKEESVVDKPGFIVPNFMAKAIAEQAGVRMPGFFGYLL
jgi:hypothetical protein